MLRCFASRVKEGVPLTIAVFGDSVTAGNYRRPQETYPRVMARVLSQMLPQNNATVKLYGYPGASAGFMRACHTSMLPIDADLYIVEITDNYMKHNVETYRAVGSAIEQLLFALHKRRTNSPGALMLLSPFPQSCSKALKAIARRSSSALNAMRAELHCLSNATLPAILEGLGATHNIPVASTRLALQYLFREAEDPAATMSLFLEKDLVHPNAVGHRMLAQLLTSAIAVAPPPEAPAACPAVVHQRQQRFGGHRSGSPEESICAIGEEMKRHVLFNDGWNYTVDYSSQGQPKPGYVANRPGATLHVCHHNGRSPTPWWQFGYLRSWKPMGKIKGECVQGCSCKSRVWDAHADRTKSSQTVVSKLIISRLAANQNCSCTIRLTLLEGSSSAGRTFKLTAFFSGFGRIYNANFALCPSEGNRWGTGGCSSTFYDRRRH